MEFKMWILKSEGEREDGEKGERRGRKRERRER